MKGRVHSFETCGTVDGPGVRFIIFLQGCPLRCKFCHNPDTWKLADGKEMEATDIVSEIETYLPFIQASNGGVTISGGEPLLQPEFLLDLLKKLKAKGIHTAIDTSGGYYPPNMDEILQYTDLVLLDIKHIHEQTCKQLTGKSNKQALFLLNQLEVREVPVWIRHVLVPGWTLNEKDLIELGDYLKSFHQIQRIDLLPFHQMGVFKWEALGIPYELIDVNPPTESDVNQCYDWLYSNWSKRLVI